MHKGSEEADGLGRSLRLRAGRVQPDGRWVGVYHPLHPHGAGLLVEMLDRTAGMADLIGDHRGVADEDEFIVVAEFVEHVPGGGALGVATAVVRPYALVDAVVEVEEF